MKVKNKKKAAKASPKAKAAAAAVLAAAASAGKASPMDQMRADFEALIPKLSSIEDAHREELAEAENRVALANNALSASNAMRRQHETREKAQSAEISKLEAQLRIAEKRAAVAEKGLSDEKRDANARTTSLIQHTMETLKSAADQAKREQQAELRVKQAKMNEVLRNMQNKLKMAKDKRDEHHKTIVRLVANLRKVEAAAEAAAAEAATTPPPSNDAVLQLMMCEFKEEQIKTRSMLTAKDKALAKGRAELTRAMKRCTRLQQELTKASAGDATDYVVEGVLHAMVTCVETAAEKQLLVSRLSEQWERRISHQYHQHGEESLQLRLQLETATRAKSQEVSARRAMVRQHEERLDRIRSEKDDLVAQKKALEIALIHEKKQHSACKDAQKQVMSAFDQISNEKEKLRRFVENRVRKNGLTDPLSTKC